MKGREWADTQEFEEFARDALENMVPAMAKSSYVIATAPPTGSKADIKQAVEIGMAILMDKPLIVIAPDGRVIGERLLRIADAVVKGDLETEAGREQIVEQLRSKLNQ